MVIINLKGIIVEYGLRLEFPVPNNEVDYEALLARLKIVKELGAQDLRIFSNSQLVIDHVKGESEAWEGDMIKYLQKVKELINNLRSFDIQQIPKER